MSAEVIAELETEDLPASNGTIVANLRRRCGDHELALVIEEKGTTEHAETTEVRHNPREDRFRVFRVFRG